MVKKIETNIIYEGILAGLAEDDTNPNNWTTENRASRH